MANSSERPSPSLRRGQSHRRSTSGTAISPASRSGDRPAKHYTMKTPSRPPTTPFPTHSHSHSHSNSQNLRPSKSGTPAASPRMPHSVGQPYPPKLSPSGRSTAQDKHASSPNYFGLIVEQPADPRDSAMMPRDNWSPPTSSVRSFAAAIPKPVPLDANPEYEAFRKQADANRGKSGFNLSSSHFGSESKGLNSTPMSLQRPRHLRTQTHGSDSAASDVSIPRITTEVAKEAVASGGRMDVDTDSTHDSAYVSADSKRNSEASLNPPSLLGLGRHESPASFESPFATPRDRRSGLSAVDDRHPRLSMIEGRADRPTPDPARAHRAETVPSNLEAGAPGTMQPSQLRDLIEHSSESDFLLLDLRVSPQYAESRIRGAINLCIPTTLLKRATFNLQKLQSTFQSEKDQARFASWRSMKCLVVYDAFSAERRDAVSSVNTIKKFTNEGFTGSTYILRGGFHSFAAAHPDLVDHAVGNGSPSLSLSASSGATNSRPSVAPVIGGVMLPNLSNQTNPFFGNIRQNVDLADGVGQMDISLPAGVDIYTLPSWIREATWADDHGKKVSDKFLRIEQKEQSRMKEAYSVFNTNPISLDDGKKVQLSGLEKGVKNRYKDILPFEHARVKLQDKEDGACDYVNASHIKATRSHKRYIASQGPLPATFEDFWSVIWDQDVRVIVMLTAESEGGQLKCHPYWKGRDYGPIKLRPLSEKKVSLSLDKHRSTSIATDTSSSSASASSTRQNGFVFPTPSQAESGRRRANTTTTLETSTPTPLHAGNGTQNSGASLGSNGGETPYVIIRKFALGHAARPFAPIREVTHLHYPSWPDFGAPAQPSHLLALVELANVMQRAALPVTIARTDTLERGISDRNGSITSSSSGSAANGARASPPASDRRSGSAARRDAFSPAWTEEPERDPDSRPMLVHCSAGCGRTGTFCTVDSVIDMLKRQRARAAREATRRIAARERRFAEQMAAEKELRRQQQQRQRDQEDEQGIEFDADGDVAMSESGDDEGSVSDAPPYDEDEDDAVSPLATFKDPARQFPGYSSDASSGGRTPTATTAPRLSAMVTPGDEAEVEEDEEEEDITDSIDLSWLNDERIDLVAATVADFRTQRLSMVQSLRQFVLCYESVTEWIWRVQERTSVAGLNNRAAQGGLSRPGSTGRARSGSLHAA